MSRSLALERLISLAVVSASLAAATACTCDTTASTSLVPLMPPADGSAPDDAFFALACDRECPGANACEPESVPIDGGEALLLRCESIPDCSSGRRPIGSAGIALAERTAGAWLARCAALEADSVTAFRDLARDLRRHRAPGRLVRAAERSAREERRHARVMASLCRRYGHVPAQPPAQPAKEPTLLQMALHNASEGCVGEAYGAALALWQSKRSRDPLLRTALAEIAREEARHAALSWEIDAWVAPRLPPAARVALREAKRDALAALAEAPGVLGEGAREILGLPSEAQRQALVGALSPLYPSAGLFEPG